MRISGDDRRRVTDAIRAAECATSGEFVCVLAQNASTYEFYPLAWSAVLALVLPWPLVVLTLWSVQAILICQLAVFLLALLLFSSPRIRRHLVPRRVQRGAAHRAAAEQFLVRGLSRTRHGRGILLYVAEDERYARVLADDGAAAAIPPEQWQKAVALLVAQSRAGRHADGFVAALGHCGQAMAEAFPTDTATENALPDRFYVLD